MGLTGYDPSRCHVQFTLFPRRILMLMARMSINLKIADNRILLWVAAVLITLALVVFQRTTGPARPVRGEAVLGGDAISFEFGRSEIVDNDAPISIHVPDEAIEGIVQGAVA